MKKSKWVQVDGQNVQVLRKLTQGGQSKLYVCKSAGSKCVLKKTVPTSQLQMDVAQREVSLLKQMKHPNILGYITDDVQLRVKNQKRNYVVLLVVEHCPGGNLLDFANKRKAEGNPLDEKEILRMAVQMTRSIEYLHRHSPPVAHRDIKLENFLLGASGRLVLCDFGSCSVEHTRCETREERIQQEELIQQFTTPLYRAPELCDLYSGRLISEKVDVWALGCVLFALAFQKHAFEDGGKLAILSGKIPFPETHLFSDSFVMLVKWLLTLDPEQRPQIGDVLDYVEELTHCRKGANATERGSGTGERPSNESLKTKKKKSKDDSADQAAENLAQQVEKTLNVSQKSKRTSELARQRLARRKNQGQSEEIDGAESSEKKPVTSNTQHNQTVSAQKQEDLLLSFEDVSFPSSSSSSSTSSIPSSGTFDPFASSWPDATSMNPIQPDRMHTGPAHAIHQQHPPASFFPSNHGAPMHVPPPFPVQSSTLPPSSSAYPSTQYVSLGSSAGGFPGPLEGIDALPVEIHPQSNFAVSPMFDYNPAPELNFSSAYRQVDDDDGGVGPFAFHAPMQQQQQQQQQYYNQPFV